MPFDSESKFEQALISALTHNTNQWEKDVLYYPTEEDLIRNWADILFANNREINRLNNHPLTTEEMNQILDQINFLRTPLKLNGFINGKTISIKRTNSNDTLHLGKEVSLKIYDKFEIAAGNSKYQIACQPKFKTSGIYNDRRGDLMLLINGMPVIHIELKKSGIPVNQATNQIQKYSREGAFRGLFSLIQIFVAMNPEDTVYFANPGEDNKFNPNYFFHWADYNNDPICDWKEIASKLLSIPMAHQLIGFYTVADNSDGLLKIMRSYQYYAAYAISDKVSKVDWSSRNNLGGYVWHTTGSGKTLTSFKSAQLISNSRNADKVIFLVDRIELGTQSLNEYRNFASDNEDVQATENTRILVSKIKSTDPANTLMVTSIQKMSRITEDAEGLKTKDLEQMKSKRMVFIVDEAHQSTFGSVNPANPRDGMLYKIKNTFPHAIFFGFTGTPIFEENKRNDSTMSDVFGNELHRYSIADGIRDKNVLGFDLYKVLTFKDIDLKKIVALEKAKASNEVEAINNKEKQKIYYHYINDVQMVGYYDENGNHRLGIEDLLPTAQYDSPIHRKMVLEDIKSHWITLSRQSKFHALLATSSINEAIEYYRLFKSDFAELKVSCLFDPTIDNNNGSEFKSDGIKELLEDYNDKYAMTFQNENWAMYKKDIAARLAHKLPYIAIEKTPEKQIDLLIVVDQMLTGFDSKWINTLYVDKEMKYEHIIQAFSRTNRLFGPEKPFGTIRYYRKPHTMEKNIEVAIKLYSGDRPLGLFVPKLKENIEKMNLTYLSIKQLFMVGTNYDFSKLPEDIADKAKFSKSFRELNEYLEAAKIQGFKWSHVGSYMYENIKVIFDENDYLTLALRYRELVISKQSGATDVAYEVDGYLSEINTGLIDTHYMNSKFEKFRKSLDGGSIEDKEKTLNELLSTFAILSAEQQKYASIFLRDIERGEVILTEEKTLSDYISEYQVKAKNNQITKCVEVFGVDKAMLNHFLTIKVTMDTLNEYGRFDELIKTVDVSKARQYFESIEKTKLKTPQVHIKIFNFFREFILENGFDVSFN